MAGNRNIVVILARGLRSDALSDSGVWPLRTPGFAMLSHRGLRLVALSASPADPWSMSCLMSGLHVRQMAQANGQGICGSSMSWPRLLAQSGYHNVGVGLVGGLEDSLQESVLTEDVDVLSSDRCRYLTALRAKGYIGAVEQQRRQRLRLGPFEPDRLLMDPEDDIDGFIAAQACLVAERLPTNRPWALIVVFSGPGNGLPPPALYDDQVNRAALEWPFTPVDLTAVDTLAELDYPRIMLQRLEPEKIGLIRGDYLGRVSLIDHGLGRILTTLAQRPDARRTWTLLTSNRGHLLGEKGLVGHRSFLSPAIEVPLVIAPPFAAQQQFYDGLVSTVDVAATLAAIAGCDAPGLSVGRNLLPATNDAEALPALPGGCLSEFGRRIMLDTQRYRVVFDIDKVEPIALYDLLADEDQDINLVHTPVGNNLMDSLRGRLLEALLPLRASA